MNSPMKKERKVTTIRLADELNEKLKSKAEEMEVSKNAFIIKILREAVIAQ